MKKHLMLFDLFRTLTRSVFGSLLQRLLHMWSSEMIPLRLDPPANIARIDNVLLALPQSCQTQSSRQLHAHLDL